MRSLEYRGNEYNYIPFKELTEKDLPEAAQCYKSKYYDLDCGFDIETSSDKEKKLSWLYMWQFAINDLTVIGRTWEEFTSFIQMLEKHYIKDDKLRILCWIHNASYEFSFTKNWLTYNINKYGNPDIFATAPREIVKFCTSGGIEFRDSAILTNVTLKKLAKDYKTGLEKLTEAIDYNEILTPETPLDDPRIAYAINDVQILAKFNKNYIKRYYLANGLDIPLTSTAIVRNEMKRKFKAMDTKYKKKYRNRVRNSFPTEHDYKIIMRWLYRGGYVHASISDVFNEYINANMFSLDFKSSYPAVMLHNKFPYRFVDRNPKEWYKVAYNRRYWNDNAFYGLFTFVNIRSKTSQSIESKHKIITELNGMYDNGRLVKADAIDVYLTEQDWLNYIDFYEWDEVICWQYRVSSKEPLPEFLLDMVLDYYEGKEKIDKELLDYMLQKRKLNSLYGMCCSGLFHSELIFKDGEMVPSGKYKEWWKIVQSQILLPYFGIWISAYARRNLLSIVAKLDTDNAYSDTDSSKVFNYFANKYIFDDYNDRMERLNKTMYVGDHDRSLFKDLGKFTVEEKYYKFQTNGCKRYIYSCAHKDKDGMYRLHDNVTIAGMRKGTLQEKAQNEEKSVYDLFNDGLELTKLEADKLTTSYNDTPFSLEVTDYMGKTTTVIEKSCCTLVDIGFKMTILPDFLRYYNFYKDREKITVGKRI